MRFLSFALVTALATGTPATATDCEMTLAFNQPDNGGTSSVPVWLGNQALLFGEALHVNTDGTRRSYSVSDFWGEQTAINNLCNAMSDACRGLSQQGLRQRRILTQQAREQGWPTNMLSQTRISSSIIPFRNGRPCPEVNGFLVSATALHRNPISDVCDIANYVDSLVVSAIVVPKRANANVETPFQARGVQVGDLAAVMSADGQRLAFAVVGDSGPARELGEGSVALAGALLGRDQPPANYREIRGRPPYQGRGWNVPRAYVLIFPRTRDSDNPYMTQDRIDADGRRALDQWGGRERLNACRIAYGSD